MEHLDVDGFVDWIRERAADRSRLLVGLVGPPGAGKSTITERIATELSAAVAPMDGYHLPNSVLHERGLRDVKGAPDTFDVDAFAEMLRTLREGRDILLPDFDRTIDEPRPDRILVPADVDVVIVEGNYLLTWRGVAELLDEVAYIDVDTGTRVGRLIDRHVEFGKTRAEAEAWVHGSDERNTMVIEATRDRADVIVRY